MIGSVYRLHIKGEISFKCSYYCRYTTFYRIPVLTVSTFRLGMPNLKFQDSTFQILKTQGAKIIKNIRFRIPNKELSKIQKMANVQSPLFGTLLLSKSCNLTPLLFDKGVTLHAFFLTLLNA